ncbi:MAG: glycosyltransferase family 9 protein [Proteobacteria bacterium]|nr:glycosyltransferase family 9 protein [Pseudomonadota bacterium]
MNLLFVTSTRIGDAVLSTGLLDHLIRRHAGVRVTVACGAAAAPLFAALPGLERVLPMDKRPGLAHWVQLWLATATQRWDVVVDLRGSALAWLLRADTRHVWRKPSGEAHRVVQLARVLGLDAPPAPRVWLEPAHHAAARRIVPDGDAVLALGPSTSWPGKQWPLERFATLAQRLTARDGLLPDARIAVFAAADERAATAPLLAALPRERTIDAIGAGGLLEIAAALQRCRFYIGNDSGLMHLAAASGVPTLGLFGPSDDRHYAPWGAQGAVARTPLSYAELVARRRADPAERLMDTLDVERVHEAASALGRRCGLERVPSLRLAQGSA